MQRELFDTWLRERAFNNIRVISDNKSRCSRVERDLNVDLDDEFARDRLANLLATLNYTAEDERNHVPLPGNIHMAHPRAGLSSLKNAVVNYLAFRQGQRLALPANADTSSFDALKATFGVWLEDDLAKGTISSYKSNLTVLRNSINEEKGEGWFDGIAEAFRNHNENQVRNLCLQCQNFINVKKREDVEHRNTWSDKASAYNQYIDFLADHYEFENGEEQQSSVTQRGSVTPTEINGEPFDMNHAQLRNKFFNSLKSQTRYYPNNGICLLFPVRLINKIFRCNRDNRFKDWLLEDINDMVFLGEGRQNVFSEVDGLSFDGQGNVVAHGVQGDFSLYTRALDAQRHEYLRPVNAVLPRELSVDHVVALENIIRENRDNLPSLRMLTAHFNEMNEELGNSFRPRDEHHWYLALYARHEREYSSSDFRDSIMNDLRILNMEYELMETRENTRMGNR